MQSYFNNILVFLKPTKYPDGVLDHIFQVLNKKIEILILSNQKNRFEDECKQPHHIRWIDSEQLHQIGVHCALAIGGDGTMIAAARVCAPLSIPIIGVNLGTVGFLTDIAFSQFETEFSQMILGNFKAQHRVLLEASIFRKKQEIFRSCAFNDITFARTESSSLIHYHLSIDDSSVAHTRADGIIVSTPSGSTAYALSSGGPIIEPQTPALVLVPICPQNLSNRPLVIPDTRVIRIESTNEQSASVHFDGHARQSIEHQDVIVCRKALKQAQILHPLSYDYYQTLRTKLHWNAGGI